MKRNPEMKHLEKHVDIPHNIDVHSLEKRGETTLKIEEKGIYNIPGWLNANLTIDTNEDVFIISSHYATVNVDVKKVNKFGIAAGGWSDVTVSGRESSNVVIVSSHRATVDVDINETGPFTVMAHGWSEVTIAEYKSPDVSVQEYRMAEVDLLNKSNR